MQVVALETGFYDGARRRPGAIFNLDESKLKTKDGKPVLPKWVELVADAQQAKRRAESVKAGKAAKEKAGAIAASGGAVAKAKIDAMGAQLAGEGADAGESLAG